jgi:hypothetical protein
MEPTDAAPRPEESNGSEGELGRAVKVLAAFLRQNPMPAALRDIEHRLLGSR